MIIFREFCVTLCEKVLWFVQNISDVESSVQQEDQQQEIFDTSSVNGDSVSTSDLEESTTQLKKSVNGGGVKRKRQPVSNQFPPEVKSLTDVACSAAKVLSKIANKSPSEGSVKDNDNDWDFCKFLYPKLKAIPDVIRDLKDELHLEIQRQVMQTKRRVANQRAQPCTTVNSSVGYNTGSGSTENSGMCWS